MYNINFINNIPFISSKETVARFLTSTILYNIQHISFRFLSIELPHYNLMIQFSKTQILFNTTFDH